MSVPLTVVMPVYNEHEAIVGAVADVQQYVLDLVAGAQIIVVYDGSRDSTPALLDHIEQSDPRVRIIHLSIRRMKLLKFCARGLSQMIELRRRLSGRGREADVR
jgi:glycosyltransferase involved in cell wall biosynthesis